MSELIAVALITAVPAILAAVLGYLNHRKLHSIHVEINSRLTQLVASSRAEGFEAGQNVKNPVPPSRS